MEQQRTVVGFFDTTAEAQRAVQTLLAQGFTSENIMLSTPVNPKTAAGDRPTEADSSSGQFFLSLFDSLDDDQPDSPGFAIRRGTLLTVQAQSPAQAKQVADLMNKAGAVSVDEPTGLPD